MGTISMKKWLIIGLAVILVIVLLFTGISAYLGYTLTRVKRVPVEDDPARLELVYENVTFPSQNPKLLLHGWLLPAQASQKIIIMVHGEQFHRADPEIRMMEIAAHLVENGYSVLAFDLRGHGESEGSMVSGGYFEQEDLGGAVEYAGARGFDRIGVLGFSMGAVTALMEAEKNKDIDAVVADSSFADLQDIMQSEFKQRTRAPGFFLNPLLWMIKTIYGVDFPAIQPVKSVEGIAPRPVLFIHGERDETIPADHAYRLLEASHNPLNGVWIAPGSAHVRAYADHPEEYLEKIRSFFDSAF
jgi:uncharacterized protein